MRFTFVVMNRSHVIKYQEQLDAERYIVQIRELVKEERREKKTMEEDEGR